VIAARSATGARRFKVDEDELLRVVTEVGQRTAAVATVFGCVVEDGEVRCG
jgi:hypothetical protein